MSETSRILLLSDDDVVRQALVEAGFSILSESDPAIDLVLLDIDGLEDRYPRIAQVRAEHPEAPLLILSADPDPRSVVEAVRAGAHDWVARPVDPVTLGQIVDRALLRRQLSLEGRRVVQFLEEKGRQAQDDQRLLQDRVVAMAAELERAHRQLEHAHRELRGRVAQLTMLYRIGRDLTTHRNWDEALENFLRSLCKFLDARGAALLLRSQGGQRLAARSVFALESDDVEDAIEVLRARSFDPTDTAQLYALEDAREAPVEQACRPCVDREASWSRTVVPLRHRDEDLGVLLLHKTYDGDVGLQDDFYFLITIQTVLTEEVASAQAFSQLRKLQRFHERTLDHLETGLLTLDGDGRIGLANAKTKQLLQLDDVTGAVLRNFVRLGSEGPNLDEWLAAVDSKAASSIEAQLLRFRGEDEEPIPVSLVASSLPGELPNERHHVLVIEDLREKRALEAERRRAHRQKELLIMAAEWAHDVRTPLTGILHSAELLSMAVDPRSPKQRHFTVIQSEVQRINELVNHFLDYARPLHLKLEAADVVAVAREAVELARGPAQVQGHDMVLRIDEGCAAATLPVDRDQLKQVLLNLLANALEASPPTGEVLVHTYVTEELEIDEDGRRAAAFCIAVQDEGPGVPAEHEDRLFVPFFTTKPEGTGLGLASADKIVRAHGGLLRYRREGDRTVLRVILPLQHSTWVESDSVNATSPSRLEARS